ncbi:MAG: hypothetical protein J7L37_04270 [Thermococcus sp.]|nr:hypothetical protein [Thermococcus sp.]
MKRLILALVLLVGGACTFTFYLSFSTGVSWDSKGEFSNLTNVTVPKEVLVEKPLELELAHLAFPELENQGEFEESLTEAISGALEEENLSPNFTHVRPRGL